LIPIVSEQSSRQSFSFVQMEHEVLAFWETRRIFERSVEATSGKKPYIFYDGPPFATGLPHHGHLVCSTIKDIIPRYFTMTGRHVSRRWGWDCHGLPIEHEIDKRLGLSVGEAVEKLGVKGYNDECRSIVQRYASEWRKTITRLGRWVDFEDDYKTMEPWYMESVWWAFKQLWDKGYVYEGVKVMPVSTALGTVLANFEANQNYRDVEDPAITVLFPMIDSDEHLSVWTTTPWTLPSNLAICVREDMEYALVKDKASGKKIWLAASRTDAYSKRHDLERIATCAGSALVGKRYAPIFPYFAEEVERGAFRVVADGYVTDSEGTGLVHQAPAFGEDDFRICKREGIEAFVCPVSMQGEFTEEVTDFAGQHVKDADREIMAYLKTSGALFERATLRHAYPFCYRSETPLIYRAIPSWYVRVTDFRDDLVKVNNSVRWVPGHIKEGRFGNWLRDAADWAVSRNRVWGTPLPIWRNDVNAATRCVGSIDELAELTGVRVTDLHREHVDPLTFEIEGEAGTYRRVSEVLDCWFESGSMPYAQLHYPFENKPVFRSGFPAEFIAEGLDQTRGWFYTLMVLSTAIFEKPAFRNVVVNGLVLAKDGAKMSKSKENFTPPDSLMETYGADALRLYLINSPLVRGEEQRFEDDGVREMVRRALLPWYNAFSFLETYANIDGWSPEKGLHLGENPLDRWILSRLQTLKRSIAEEMARYRLYSVVPNLFEFIGDLTNWYIRLNRSRFWASETGVDKIAAFSTLYTALSEIGLAMAPFAPFLSEHLYRRLAALGGVQPEPESVHLCAYPEADQALVDAALEAAVARMRQVILLGRREREQKAISLRTPLREVRIVHSDQALLDDIATLEPYIAAELNVKTVAYDTDEGAYVGLKAKPNFALLGSRLGKRVGELARELKQLPRETLADFESTGEIELLGEAFSGEEIQVFRDPVPGTGAHTNRLITLVLDCALDDELRMEGKAREIVNRVQRARKAQGLAVSDRIKITYQGDSVLTTCLKQFKDYIAGETLANEICRGKVADGATRADIDGASLAFVIERD